jgi:hypothetical protein
MRRLALPLALFVAACTPMATAPAAPPAAPAPMAAAAPGTGVVGNYTVNLTNADMPGDMSADMRTGLVGMWNIAIHPQNHFVVTYNGSQVVEGPYRMNGNQITFTGGESGQYACSDPATYTVQRASNGQLTFTLVGSDPCPGRSVVLTTHPLAVAP